MKPDDQNATTEESPTSPGRSSAQSSPSLARLTLAVRSLSKAGAKTERAEILVGIQQEIQALRDGFTGCGSRVLAKFCSALLELTRDPLSGNDDVEAASPLRTLSKAVDVLNRCSTTGDAAQHAIEKIPVNLLVVDDEPVCRRTLALSLRRDDLRVTTCETAEQALAFLRAESCDVVLTDILMPKMDGLDFCVELRKLPNHSATPVIFVTALADFETRSKSILKGGCDLVVKPFRPNELLVKAFTFAMKHRLGPVGRQPTQTGLARKRGDAFSPNEKQGATHAPKLSPQDQKGVICLEANGRIRSMNQVGGTILGYTPGEMLERHVREVIPDELQSGDEPVTIEQLLHGNIAVDRSVRMIALRKDKSQVPLAVMVSPTTASGRKVFVLLFRPKDKEIVQQLSASAEASAREAELARRLEHQSKKLLDVAAAKAYLENSARDNARSAAEAQALLQEEQTLRKKTQEQLTKTTAENQRMQAKIDRMTIELCELRELRDKLERQVRDQEMRLLEFTACEQDFPEATT